MIFFIIVFALYWALSYKYRWILLLISSYYFYMSWNVKYIVLIIFTTLISYVAALLLEMEKRRSVRKLILSSTLFLCIGVLFVFKYLEFVSKTVIDLLNLLSIHLHPVTLRMTLPVGISFYTFQTLSYVIDVYKGEVEAERHFGIYATFISFFPQLVAGPIERTKSLLPQIKERHYFNNDQAMYGLRLILWGFFKKVVVSDNLAVYVDKIYNNIFQFQGFVLVVATVFFALQIYCDFSGYSDIARGVAKLMGIELMENFRSPYFSTSIKEFWGKWHISLSTWFRDYIYIPLGGNRTRKIRHYVNLLITFLISGIWHGANWTFVVWGGIHGVAQIVENILGVRANRKNSGFLWWFKTCLVFTFVTFAWVFFRTQNFTEAIYFFSHMFCGINDPIKYLKLGITDIMGKDIVVSYFFFCFCPLFIYDYVGARKNIDTAKLLSNKNIIFQWVIYIIMGLLIVFLSPKGVATEFVYFQF